MTLQAAFIFLSPDANSTQNRNVVATDSVSVTCVATKNYHDAEAVAVELVNAGITSIELCGGFGHIGVSQIAQAVAGKASVGAVRFDCHPGLDGSSGDNVFNNK